MVRRTGWSWLSSLSRWIWRSNWHLYPGDILSGQRCVPRRSGALSAQTIACSDVCAADLLVAAPASRCQLESDGHLDWIDVLECCRYTHAAP